MTATSPAPASLVLERDLPHPPEKVWRALTEGPLLERWLMRNDFQPVVGHAFTFRADPLPQWNGITACRVLAVEPPRRLAYSWEATGEQAGLRTVVTWTLTPHQGGTRLRMEQAGFRPEDAHAAEGASWGWNKFLRALERILPELGQVRPPGTA